MACPILIRISHGGHCVPPSDPCPPKYPALPITFAVPVDGPDDKPKKSMAEPEMASIV